ncbi:Hypp7491 [Branchiostoma lanceolatum]|uniref:Hypp7491 protein n=1 Tax=Branchiostoma lanceolatum TaxID=7740 RepID=A0A8J9Z188_BRALA|nr:Hypp7491 [Branchiostoma lanceolatum]
MNLGFHRRLLLVCALFLCWACVGAYGLQCFACLQQISHAACNRMAPQNCTGQDENACYTQVERYLHTGKKITKGCSNRIRCQKGQSLNHDCDRPPRKCTYCCVGNLCNRSNGQQRALSHGVLIITCLALTTVFLPTTAIGLDV